MKTKITFIFKMGDGQVRKAEGRDMWEAWKALGYSKGYFAIGCASWSKE